MSDDVYHAMDASDGDIPSTQMTYLRRTGADSDAGMQSAPSVGVAYSKEIRV